MGASLGHQSRFAIDAATPFDGSSYRFEANSFTVRKTGTILDTNGIRGTRSHASERTRTGPNNVAGQITLNPSPNDLDIFLDYMGMSETADVWSLTETLTSFELLADLIADVHLYSTCYINRATFRASPGEFVELVLDIIGTSETTGQTWAGTIPALGTTATADDAYVYSDLSALTLQASGRQASVSDWELILDNALEAKFTNAVNADSIISTDRIVTLNATVEWSSSTPDNTDLYEQALLGAAGTLTLTNGTVSCSMAMGALQVADQSPIVSGKGEIPLELSMVARKSGSTDELEITNDATV